MPRTSDARDRMVRAAAQLLGERGVEALSVREVVTLGRAPRGSIYHHFPDGKAQLVAEATAYAGDVVAAVLAAAVAEADSFAEVVETVADHWVRTLEGSDFARGCPVAAAALEHDEHPAAREAAGRSFGRWTQILADDLVRRGRTPAQAHDGAVLVLGALEGAILLARAQGDVAPLRATARALGGLVGDDPSPA